MAKKEELFDPKVFADRSGLTAGDGKQETPQPLVPRLPKGVDLVDLTQKRDGLRRQWD